MIDEGKREGRWGLVMINARFLFSSLSLSFLSLFPLFLISFSSLFSLFLSFFSLFSLFLLSLFSLFNLFFLSFFSLSFLSLLYFFSNFFLSFNSWLFFLLLCYIGTCQTRVENRLDKYINEFFPSKLSYPQLKSP